MNTEYWIMQWANCLSITTMYVCMNLCHCLCQCMSLYLWLCTSLGLAIWPSGYPPLPPTSTAKCPPGCMAPWCSGEHPLRSSESAFAPADPIAKVVANDHCASNRIVAVDIEQPSCSDAVKWNQSHMDQNLVLDDTEPPESEMWSWMSVQMKLGHSFGLCFRSLLWPRFSGKGSWITPLQHGPTVSIFNLIKSSKAEI